MPLVILTLGAASLIMLSKARHPERSLVILSYKTCEPVSRALAKDLQDDELKPEV